MYYEYEKKMKVLHSNKVGGTNSEPMKKYNVDLIPINIQTQITSNPCYRQIGALARKEAIDVINPLYGRQLINGRDSWQYYTITEHNVRLPLIVNGKSSTGEYGCSEIHDGDNVQVQGYNDMFNVTLYNDIDRIQYLPHVY